MKYSVSEAKSYCFNAFGKYCCGYLNPTINLTHCL